MTITAAPVRSRGPRVLLRASEAAAACGVSPRTWRRWCSAALVPRPVRIAKVARWVAGELRAWSLAGCPSRERWEEVRHGR